MFLPKTKATDKRVAVVAPARGWRQILDPIHVATTQYHVISFQGVLQSFHNIEHMTPPLLTPQTLQTANPNVLLARLLVFVGKVSQLHRHKGPIDDHG